MNMEKSIERLPLTSSRAPHLFQRKRKRLFDIAGSLALIILSSPLMIILALIIRKDGGSSIYMHERIGHKGKSFQCYKFRSMVMDSQEVLQELLDSDPAAKEEWNKDFKLKNDPRITRVGRFLRKTSLDELPQLFNVLKGEMSLVGPRPVVAEELERYGHSLDKYLSARPGMTGLWQVSGRNDVSYEMRVKMDRIYIENWKMTSDVALLFKTIRVVTNREGAY